MKKIYIILVAVIAITQIAHAQWTNVSGTGNYYLNSGNVGIGTPSTTSPTSPLEIQQPISTGQTVSMQQWEWAGTPGTWNLRLDMYHTGSAIEYRFVQKVGYTDNNVLAFSNGYVGIGTTSPGAKLDVAGSIFAANQIGGAGGIYIGQADYQASLLYDNATGNLDITPRSGYNTVFTAGNVGIGTITPDAKLAVNGTIHTKEVKVDLIGWPDYVFKPKYKLLSILEVKVYIDRNQHLPEMPSEQEVKQNGINLGEMNILLTKKVEELTLYLIEKDAQLQSQQKQIDQLKEQLAIITKALTKN
ncbi:MAG: hypothetical protein JWQ34_319 [Mucilaginibacter sp.]|uniref:hypothetical protein n=1 Tax=Mucilaginibacter sp. TaxID=1882438 RepID=UPI00261A4B3F|nr:hypothetical protein [Mucilaginibacter sp.]MDB5002094.1 hypothetical protein [Mucilaginibacter sp.]